jgi:heptosyltransferase-1
MNILIVKLSAIGDVIHTLPALNAIRKHYPDGCITWLVEEEASALIENHPALDHVLVSKRKRWVKGLLSVSCLKNIREAYRFIKSLRDTPYDLIIDFQGLLKSGIMVGLARGKRKVGFGRGMDHMEYSYSFLNECVPAVGMDNHALLRSMMLLNALGIPAHEVLFKIPIQDPDRHLAEELLFRHRMGEDKPLVAINPMAKWETKLWSNEKFANLADILIGQFGANVVFTGSLGDRKTIQHIISVMKEKAVNLAGETTLRSLAALFEKADVLVSTDTGPMHLSAAVGTPVVALLGPTAPWRTGPFGSGHQIIRAGIKCSPCYKRKCDTRKCMEQISVRHVLDGVRKLEIV